MTGAEAVLGPPEAANRPAETALGGAELRPGWKDEKSVPAPPPDDEPSGAPVAFVVALWITEVGLDDAVVAERGVVAFGSVVVTLETVVVAFGSVVVTLASVLVTLGTVVVTFGSVVDTGRVVDTGTVVVTFGTVVVTFGTVVVTFGTVVVTFGTVVVTFGTVVVTGRVVDTGSVVVTFGSVLVTDNTVVIVNCGTAPDRPAITVLAMNPRTSRTARAAARLTALVYPDLG